LEVVLRADWSCGKGLQKNSCVKLKANETTKKMNPAVTGNLTGFDIDSSACNPSVRLMWAEYDCAMKSCKKCNCRWRWEIFPENLDACIISTSGEHTNNFVPLAKGEFKGLPRSVLSFVEESTEKGDTPSAIEQNIKIKFPALYLDSRLRQVKSHAKYDLRQLFGKNSDPELVEQFLKTFDDKDSAKVHLYPEKENATSNLLTIFLRVFSQRK